MQAIHSYINIESGHARLHAWVATVSFYAHMHPMQNAVPFFILILAHMLLYIHRKVFVYTYTVQNFYTKNTF